MKVISSVVLMLVSCSLAGFASPAEVNLKKGDRIVFLGDSITAGGTRPDGYITLIKASMDKTHPDLGVDIINAGGSGNRVMDLQSRLQKDVLDKKPSMVFIFIGANDVGYWTRPRRTGTTKEQFESGIKEIVGKIQAAGAQVVLCTAAVLGEKTDGTNRDDTRMEEYCEVIRRLATETKVPLVDLRKAFIDYLKANNPENQEKGILTTDSVHMNAEGNKLVAQQMLKVLGMKLIEESATPAEK